MLNDGAHTHYICIMFIAIRLLQLPTVLQKLTVGIHNDRSFHRQDKNHCVYQQPFQMDLTISNSIELVKQYDPFGCLRYNVPNL